MIGLVKDLEKILRETVVDELIFAMPLKKIEGADRYISIAEEMGVAVRIIPDWQIHSLTYKPGVASVTFEEFMGVPTMSLKSTPPNQAELLIKAMIIDYTGAVAGLVVTFPFFLIIGDVGMTICLKDILHRVSRYRRE